MYPSVSQFSSRADGMPEAMPPSAFERNQPTPKPTPKFSTTPRPSKKPKPSGGLTLPSESTYKPIGSGASAWVGGSLGGGGGAMSRK